MIVVLIAAVSLNGVIGRTNGDLPWHVKEDFQHFKNTTHGFPVIMGRKTFNALKKPLKNRVNIIITADRDFKPEFEEIIITHNISEALEHCKKKNPEKVFIIGGGQIYKQVLDANLIDTMVLSKMKFEAEGEIKFPNFDINNWELISTEDREQFKIVTYNFKKEKIY